MKWRSTYFLPLLLLFVLRSLSDTKEVFEDMRLMSSIPPPSIEDNRQVRCALCFFGLPRSYKTMVLPSIERNILPSNPDCDIFVHYFYQEEDSAGRFNDGGKVDPNEILLLQESIHNESSSSRVIKFVNDTREGFFQKRRVQLWRYHEAYNKDGKQLYFPWNHTSWDKSSLDNMVMQWHSIEGAFNLMEDHANQNNIHYARVAMLRNDVLYLTPINIMQLDSETVDSENQHFVIPSFCRYPVNDRMIYGPYDAVRVWSAERFRLIEERVQQNETTGNVMHSERFMNESIFPAITQQYGYKIHLNRDICFIRTRTESIALTDDCRTSSTVRRDLRKKNMTVVVEQTIGRKCISKRTEFINGRSRNTVQCFD